MSLTIVQLLLGLALLAIPAYLVHLFDLRRMHMLLMTFARVLVVCGVVGGAVWCLQTADSAWANVLAVLLLLPLGTWLTVRRARLSLKSFFIPLLAGNAASMVVVGSYCYFLLLGQRSLAATTVIIPLAALLTGAAVGMTANGLRAYYLGLRHHNELYLYLLGNGSTHSEALRHMVRRAFQAAMQRMLRQLSGASLMAVPVVTIVLLMAGTTVMTAVAMQVVLLAAIMAHTMLAMFVALIVARRYGFDPYKRPK